MIDSVLSALLPQLNQPFARTLLLVIADRADEGAEGSGEGWRVLHQHSRAPTLWRTHGTDWWYWAPAFGGNYIECDHLLPPFWYEATQAMSYYTEEGDLADFPEPFLAYLGAAEGWRIMTEEQKHLSLEVFK